MGRRAPPSHTRQRHAPGSMRYPHGQHIHPCNLTSQHLPCEPGAARWRRIRALKRTPKLRRNFATRFIGPILPKPADVSTLTAPPATGGLTWSSPSLDHEGVCLRDGLQPLQTPQTTAKSVLKTMAERIGRQKRGKRAPPSGPQGIWRASSPMPSITSP